MGNLTMALNGRIIETEHDSTDLLPLAEEWNEWAKESEDKEFYFTSARQIVYRDNRFGTCLTAWVENTSDGVSFQVLTGYEYR